MDLAPAAQVLGLFGLGTSLNVAAALLPARERSAPLGAARVAAAAITAGALGLPFLLRGVPSFFVGIAAQGLIVQTWRVAEVLREPWRYPRRERALRVLAMPFEWTFLERRPAEIPWRDLIVSTLLLALGVPALFFAARLAPSVTPYDPRGWPRWLGAVVAGYVVMEGMTLQWVALLRPFGLYHRTYQRHPILSRSIAEFWGVRWSSVVHRYLRANVYEPLARRRRPRLGVMAAFAVSAGLHGYLVWPAAGAVPALWMLSFFVAHGAAMVLEARLGVRRWPGWVGRIWVASVFAATSPLFFEPLLRVVGI